MNRSWCLTIHSWRWHSWHQSHGGWGTLVSARFYNSSRQPLFADCYTVHRSALFGTTGVWTFPFVHHLQNFHCVFDTTRLSSGVPWIHALAYVTVKATHNLTLQYRFFREHRANSRCVFAAPSPGTYSAIAAASLLALSVAVFQHHETIIQMHPAIHVTLMAADHVTSRQISHNSCSPSSCPLCPWFVSLFVTGVDCMLIN